MSEPRASGFLMAALILIACAGLAAVALPVLRGQIYTDAEPNDLNRQALPYRFFYERSLKAGDSFLWCPDIQCGFDLHGEGQVGMYHPLHLLLYRLLPLQAAFDVELLLNYPIMLLGMMLFLRRWGLSREAALFGGIAFAFSSFNLIRIPNPNAVDIIAHYPWLLLAVDLVMREPGRRAAWGLPFAAVLIGSMLLCGCDVTVACLVVWRDRKILTTPAVPSAVAYRHVRRQQWWGAKLS